MITPYFGQPSDKSLPMTIGYVGLKQEAAENPGRFRTRASIGHPRMTHAELSLMGWILSMPGLTPSLKVLHSSILCSSDMRSSAHVARSAGGGGDATPFVQHESLHGHGEIFRVLASWQSGTWATSLFYCRVYIAPDFGPSPSGNNIPWWLRESDSQQQRSIIPI